MFIFWGVYKWGEKPLGYKQGLCYRCKSVTIWHRLRYLPVIHVFFVPLIPLGIFKEWVCDQCNVSPQRKGGITAAILLGLLSLPFFGLALLTILVAAGDLTSIMLGLLLAAFGLALIVWMVWKIRSAKRDNILQNKFAQDNNSLLSEPCLYCGGEIINRAKPECFNCGAKVYEKVDEFRLH